MRAAVVGRARVGIEVVVAAVMVATDAIQWSGDGVDLITLRASAFASAPYR